MGIERGYAVMRPGVEVCRGVYACLLFNVFFFTDFSNSRRCTLERLLNFFQATAKIVSFHHT